MAKTPQAFHGRSIWCTGAGCSWVVKNLVQQLLVCSCRYLATSTATRNSTNRFSCMQLCQAHAFHAYSKHSASHHGEPSNAHSVQVVPNSRLCGMRRAYRLQRRRTMATGGLTEKTFRDVNCVTVCKYMDAWTIFLTHRCHHPDSGNHCITTSGHINQPYLPYTA